ncbi:hypothetical protein BSG1_02205 [Bacillus sp. SG-1]|nr:hypothetical protein BSG1_02205 [Bacillus sp. SG-1]
MLSILLDDSRNQIKMVPLYQLVPEDYLVRKIVQAVDMKSFMA